MAVLQWSKTIYLYLPTFVSLLLIKGINADNSLVMKRQFSITLVLIYYCLPIFSQQTVDSLYASLSRQLSGNPTELVYLQTSKGIYETGEDLWFKAYQLDAQSFGLSDQSQTLYLQMISDKDSVVWQEKYPVEKGVACGHVYVDEKLPEGDYFLEAYSRHSFYNDTTRLLSSRKVKVLKNIAHNSQPSERQKKDSIRFELFPEGGNLISDIPTRLAFKTTDGKGNPVDIEGSLYQDEELISPIKSSHYGMGVLSFTPTIGKQYRVELKDGKSYPLPDIQRQGMSLGLLRQDKEQLEFIISQSKGLPEQEIYLVGQLRGIVCCVAQGVLKNRLKVKIPVKEFPYQGITEFTLLDKTMQPVAERLVYVHPEKKLHITIAPEQKSYALREKASLQIKVTDEAGKPVKTNLGISVFDKAYSNPADPVHILTHCYLSSQIRGKIYDPAYYFNEENKDRMQAMDLLLLTQGWRRYIWNATHASYQGQMFLTDEITGTQRIKNKKKSRQEKGTEQLIQVSGAEGNSMFVWGDSLGQFTVKPDMMKELRGGYVYLKPMLSEEFKPELQINDLFPVIDTIRKSRANTYPTINLSQYEKENTFIQPVVSQDSTILLDEVTVTGKGRRLFRDKFMGRLDSLAQMDFGPWVCKHGWLENYKDGYTHHHDPRYCPCVVDDGEPRTPPVIGKKYHIMKAEYFPCNAQGGCCFKPIDRQWVVYEGAIYSEEELLRRNNLWRAKGYYAARQFYQPDEVDRQVSTPDARNTLLWQPAVITDEKGEATVSFYCSDINTGFIGVVEGVDGTGLLGTGQCEFRVIRK